MSSWRRKAEVVEAVQFDGTNEKECARCAGDEHGNHMEFEFRVGWWYLRIDTRATVLTDETFHRLFEPVPAEAETASLRAQLAEATKQAETDRQHALRLFRDLHATSEERDALRSQLAEARAAAPRWVPVTERLPEPGVHVLIDLDGDVLIARFFESDWWLDPGGELIGDITRWMPLPGATAQAEER